MLFNIVLIVAAAWRITSILNREYIAYPLRHWLGVTKDIATGMESYPDSWLGYLIACFRCISVWGSLLTILVWAVCPYILWPLAVSTAVILLERYT